MTFVQELINRLFPNKIVYHHLSGLIDQLPEQNNNKDYIFVSIEKNNGCREFCYFTIKELIFFYEHCPSVERSLYEIIFPANIIKSYVDFEYYIDNNRDIQNHFIGPNCCLKILHYLLNCLDNTHREKENYIDIVLQQFLVLEA